MLNAIDMTQHVASENINEKLLWNFLNLRPKPTEGIGTCITGPEGQVYLSLII